MKRLLTYGWLLLTLLASLFVMPSCQEEDTLSDTTDVMLTFTTRAEHTQGTETSTAVVPERMKNLRVIMVRENGTVVDNYKPEENIEKTEVTFTFSTPIKSSGEYFTFYAVANEESITPPSNDALDWWLENTKNLDKLTENQITNIKTQEIGNGNAFSLGNGQNIPQTKIWTVYVPQREEGYKIEKKLQLDYVASKISVKFKNQTESSQTLSNIRITGITPNGKGRLFCDYTKNGTHDIYEEAYVQSDVTLDGGIKFNDVNGLAQGNTSDVQTYYSYPIDAGNINTPMLYATWNEKEYHMPIGITSLPRNTHLQIEVSLLQGKFTVDYKVVDWEEHEVHIGTDAPTTPDDGYNVQDWGNGDITISGGSSGGNNWELSDGTIINPDKILDDWTGLADPNANNNLVVTIPPEDLVEGYEVLLDFECAYKNCSVTNHFRIFFTTYQNDGGNTSIETENSNQRVSYEYVYGKSYTRHLTIDETVLTALEKAGGELVLKTIEDPLCDPDKLDSHPYGIKIKAYVLINPLSL